MLDNASKVATIIIATVAVLISAFQWFIARDKLRLDLYSRRFDVHARTINFVQAMMEWTILDVPERLEKHRAFSIAAREAQFLFASDPSIAKLLDEINTKAFVVKGWVEIIGPEPSISPQQKLEFYEKKQAALEDIMGAVGPLEIKLAPFLAFGHKRFEPLPWRKYRKEE